MEPTILNAVLCERVLGSSRYSLVNVGSKWRRPPASVAIWVELANLSERSFDLSIEIWRGRQFVDASHEELVLQGQAYWQTWFLFENTTMLEPKTHKFLVLIDGVPAHTIVGDFGADGAP